jgi:hypothetical protein
MEQKYIEAFAILLFGLFLFLSVINVIYFIHAILLLVVYMIYEQYIRTNEVKQYGKQNNR